MNRALWPITLATLTFLLACLTGGALTGPQDPARWGEAVEPPGRPQERSAPDRPQDPRAALERRLDAIQAAAVQAGRASRDPVVQRAAQAVLEQVRAIRAELGLSSPPTTPPTQPPPPGTRPGQPPPTVPPSQPPPPGSWVQPDDVGSTGPYPGLIFGANGSNPLAKGFVQLSDHKIAAGSGAQAVVLTHYNGVNGQPLDWHNVEVRAAPGAKTKWLFIGYDAGPWSFTNTTWADVSVEHANYLTALRGLRWERCLFTNIGGQGVQVVYPVGKRHYQTSLSPAGVQQMFATWGDEWHEVVDCAFVQVGQPSISGRTGFAASFFGGGPNPVRVARSYFRTSSPFDNNGPRDCTGAVMAHGRTRFELLDTYVEFLNGDRSVVQVWNCVDGKPGTTDVLLRGNMILAAKAVEIRVPAGQGAVVEIAGNVGSTCDAMVSTNPPGIQTNQASWDPSKIVYQGPLAVDATVVVP